MSPEIVVGLLMQSIELSFNITDDVPRVLPEDITWTLNDTVLLPSDTVMFSPDRQSVTLKNLELDQEGEYTINVTNIVGDDSAYIFLDVESMTSIPHISFYFFLQFHQFL